jgi:predicted lipoprotein with Yx(FWY)xxD motif
LAVGYEAAEGARARAVAGAGAGFALLTLGGYLLSVWVGLFGFKEVRTTAGIVAGVVEVAALGLLGRLAVGAPVVRRTAGAVPWGGAVVALAVLIGSVASASGASSARPAGPVLLEARRVDGTTVLTNGRGFTLYWFARDSATASRCYGTCASYWPPVLGRPKAGPGVRGVLGTVSRTGGGVQATFDHHPLYAYVGDSSPGSANGNGLNLNGGLWHEVTLANSG